MVVFLQLPSTWRTRGYAPMVMMTLGAVLYGFGVVNVTAGFVVAVIILTIGEIVIVPVSQAIVAQLALKNMRGRYMAVFSYVWFVSSTLGPRSAGIVVDNYNRNLFWYGSFLLKMMATGAYLGMNSKIKAKKLHMRRRGRSKKRVRREI